MTDPMPTFTILGKDELAVDAIDAYMGLCQARGLDEQAAEVWKAREEVLAWQGRNQDATKLPDHKHVPVPKPADTYISRVTDQLAAALPDCDADLIRLYALLALTTGEATTLEHVHDAWGLWRATTRPDHPSIVPFDELKPEVQELDRAYTEAIRQVAASLRPPTEERDRDYLSVDAFAGKVEWEGGIVDALDYGLKHTDLDPNQPDSAKLREAWARLERLYEPVREQKDIVADLLDEIAAADEDDERGRK